MNVIYHSRRFKNVIYYLILFSEHSLKKTSNVYISQEEGTQIMKKKSLTKFAQVEFATISLIYCMVTYD